MRDRSKPARWAFRRSRWLQERTAWTLLRQPYPIRRRGPAIATLVQLGMLHIDVGHKTKAQMVIAVIEKAALGLGILGTSLRTHSVAAAIAAGDSLIALIYILYLAGF